MLGSFLSLFLLPSIPIIPQALCTYCLQNVFQRRICDTVFHDLYVCTRCAGLGKSQQDANG